ncbi:helix-turn-helix transcriptional regulator [Actinacidiphila rubida]|nr:LuxR family transcriptional regulator [Actinacidiphila rubida]
MVGRDREQARLAAFLEAAEGQALVLRGEAGVGKSALADHVADAAARDGHLVLRAAGVEAESELPYAGLHQLLYPLLPEAAGLDATARAAFDAVFGRTEGPPPSVMTLGIAVLSLVSSVASRTPLLLVLDDGQWLDDASAAVVGFAGRRLAGSPVKLLVAVRADIPSPFDTAALPDVLVAPLADADAARLLERHSPALPADVRVLVLEQAGGNPLALLELPAHIAARHGGQAPADLFGPHGVPLPRRLQDMYGTRVAALGDAVRAELLKGALDGAGAGPAGAGPAGSAAGGSGGAGPGAAEPGAAGAEAGVGPAGAAAPVPRATAVRYRMRDAEEAVACGLLVVEPVTGDFAFRHPLVRSSVVQLATPNQRRAAHRALADVHRDDVERRATHLAAATVDPDEDVARALEEAAQSATRRGGALAAVGWLTRAAELSEDHAGRSRRLGDAAFIAGHAARLGQARRLVRTDSSGADDTAASALATGYQALYQDGDVRSAHRQVAAVVERLRDDAPDGGDPMHDRLLPLLLAVSQYAADPALWQRTHALLDSLGDLVPERARLYAGTWSDVVRHGAGWAGPVERLAAGLQDQPPWDIARLAVSAYHLDVLGPLRPHLQRVVERELETGAIASGMVMLHLIMLDGMALGEWDAAERTGQRALSLETEHGHELFAHQSRGYLAQLAAMRGQTARARELQAVVDAWARPRGIGFLSQIADSAGATAALSEGDYETAYLHALGITSPGTFRPYAYQASRTLLDLVEAALHTGRAEQARAHAVAARDAGLPELSPRLAVLTYGALALTAEDEAEAAGMYARAADHPAAARFPFEMARIGLMHGTRVRRAQGGTAARLLLAPAVEVLERLGATGWAERARAELRATGVATRGSAGGLTPLTHQERRIAELAAGGLTNKEIGRQMRLSPRTVSAHLYRIFPKLGITSRAALRDALTATPEATATPTPR